MGLLLVPYCRCAGGIGGDGGDARREMHVAVVGWWLLSPGRKTPSSPIPLLFPFSQLAHDNLSSSPFARLGRRDPRPPPMGAPNSLFIVRLHFSLVHLPQLLFFCTVNNAWKKEEGGRRR